MKKSIIKLALLLVCNYSFSQTNLIDTSSWFEGTGSVSGFSANGSAEENIREIGIGPHGVSVLLWKAVPNATSNSGGWTTDAVNIDITKTYRFTVWAKKLNSNDGSTYFRTRAITSSGASAYATLSSTNSTSPSFIDDLPTLGDWYLLVGYMHHNGYSNTVSLGGVYSGLTGIKMLDCIDYKFQSTAIQMTHIAFLSNDTNALDTQFLYGPTMYEVNGLEPSIQDLINSHPDNQSPSKPTLSSTAQTDTTIDLSWSGAIDNIGVTGYKVYKNGMLETTLANVSTYQVTGLTAETSYSFTVTALDTASNESIVSNALNITTDNIPLPATNLLDTSGWTIGTGSVIGFNLQGENSENSRELGTDPHGLQNVLWRGQPIENTNGKRGWGTDYVNIDHTKTYRITSWVKKTNSKDGTIYLIQKSVDDLGNNTSLDLDGVLNGASYLYSSNPIHLDVWYLIVAYIHESGYNSTTSIGGVYDVNGVKQSNTKEDAKFSTSATRLRLENVLWFSSNTDDEFISYAPTLYEVNGQEPTIEELINAQPNNNPTYPSGTSGIWSINNQDVYYNTGNVGIGTTTPDEKLTVKGSIHSEEVRVDLSVPAPDYVFETDYTLTPLEKLQNYIKTYKHLPNIPSAKTMEANGVELGIMNMKLLEKIEELTLYILQQQKELKSQKEKHQHLDNRLINLEILTKSKKK